MVSGICIDWQKREILGVLNVEPEKPLGFYGHPGGKMKEGEAPEKAVIRELFQETNQEGAVTKYRVEIPKTGPEGDYIHYFIFVKIVSSGRELKNHEDSKAVPRWNSIQEIMLERTKIFRSHIQGLRLVLEKMVESREMTKSGKTTKHGIPILSQGLSPALELLNELGKTFNEKGQFIPYYRRRI